MSHHSAAFRHKSIHISLVAGGANYADGEKLPSGGVSRGTQQRKGEGSVWSYVLIGIACFLMLKLSSLSPLSTVLTQNKKCPLNPPSWCIVRRVATPTERMCHTTGGTAGRGPRMSLLHWVSVFPGANFLSVTPQQQGSPGGDRMRLLFPRNQGCENIQSRSGRLVEVVWLQSLLLLLLFSAFLS